MNKRSLRIAGWAIGLSLAFGAIGTAVGAFNLSSTEAVELSAAYSGDSPYAWTLATGNAAAAEGANGYALNGVTWSATRTGGSIQNVDGTKGQQYGTGSTPTTALTLTAPLSSIGANRRITGITVNASTAKSGTAKLSVSIGETAILNNRSLTTDATDYSNASALDILTSSGGNITVSFSNTAKAFYLKKIVITFEATSSATYSLQSVEIGGAISNADFYTTQSVADNSGFNVTAVMVNDKDPSDTYSTPVESGITYHWVNADTGLDVDFPITVIGNYNVKVWVSIDGESVTSEANPTLSKRYVTGTLVVSEALVYDFSEISGLGDWGSSYTEHIVEYSQATVTFASACKQTTTITDVPVTKGGDVSIVLDPTYSKYSIVFASFACKQWSDKSQTITLYSSNSSLDGNIEYASTGVTSTNFAIASASLKSHSGAVKIGFSSSSNQVGISSATLLLNDDLGSFEIESLHKNDLPYPDTPSAGVDGTDCLPKSKGGKGYFDDAMNAFNNLRKDQRELFATSAAYSKGYARLSAWAVANQASINGNNYTISKANAVSFTKTLNGNHPSLPLIIAVLGTGLAAAGGLLFLHRRHRKED